MPRIQSLLPLCFLALVAASPVTAQYNPRPARQLLSFGLYGGLGINTSAQPLTRRTGVQAQAGLFGEWAPHAWRPGFDLRAAGHTNKFFLGKLDGLFDNSGGGEVLAGPRVSYARGIAHPYVEALFGPASDSVVQADGSSTTGSSGTLKLAVMGIDFDDATHVQIRAFEYSVGRIGGPTGFLRQTFTAGLVFRFP